MIRQSHSVTCYKRLCFCGNIKCLNEINVLKVNSSEKSQLIFSTILETQYLSVCSDNGRCVSPQPADHPLLLAVGQGHWQPATLSLVTPALPRTNPLHLHLQEIGPGFLQQFSFWIREAAEPVEELQQAPDCCFLRHHLHGHGDEQDDGHVPQVLSQPPPAAVPIFSILSCTVSLKMSD